MIWSWNWADFQPLVVKSGTILEYQFISCSNIEDHNIITQIREQLKKCMFIYLKSLACIIVVSSFDDGEDDVVVDENELPDNFKKFKFQQF